MRHRLRALNRQRRRSQEQPSEGGPRRVDPVASHSVASERRRVVKKRRLEEVGRSNEQFSDAELTDLALAADADAGVTSDAIPLEEYLAARDGVPENNLLPSWYMPAPAGGMLGGWRRRVVFLIVASLVVIGAYGLCSAYGLLGLG